MALLFELLPLLAFVIAYKLAGIYVATAVITAAVVLQMGYRLLRRQPITSLHIASAAILLTLGGLTLALHDDRFILWKPTIFYWTVALGLGIGQLLMGKPMLEMLIGDQFKLSPQRWTRLTWVWIGVMTLFGIINLSVAYNFSRDFWVNFKIALYGMFVLFVLVQSWWIVMRWDGLPPEEIDGTDQQNVPKDAS